MKETRRPLTAAQFFDGDPPTVDERLEGDELVRAYWMVRGRAAELGRKESFWAATNEALASAYRQLEARTAELDEARAAVESLNQELERRVDDQVLESVERAREIERLNVRLQRRVEERSRELAAALRRIGRSASPADAVDPVVIDGRVRLIERIGEGGAGAIYLAEDLLTRERVAVKLIRSGSVVSAEALERFVREAAASARIADEAVVKTLHVDVAEDGRLYQIMELVDGLDLHACSAAGPMPLVASLRIGAGFARALSALHRARVVHRDVKPSNLMLCTARPGIRILDFGISELLDESSLHEEPERAAREPVFMGTPLYAAPEQLESAGEATAASDVYSLAVVFFEMLSGCVPFLAEWEQPRRTTSVARDVHDLRETVPEAPAELARLVGRCLSGDPRGRPSAEEFAARLAELADDAGAGDLHTLAVAELARVRTQSSDEGRRLRYQRTTRVRGLRPRGRATD